MIRPLRPAIPAPPPPPAAAPGAAGRARRPLPSPSRRHRGERGAHPRARCRRRRIVGLAAASAPPCGLRRCCPRAIRRGVRWSGFDSTARGGSTCSERQN
ncbi:hypothetical protein HU200_034216 [Digitaria exilis]|uniref:Uncharacterized protein n=1 Tax=Digitaria exilis TaxID=1010633 RepID=A0A835AQG1_9POAL|nr:hypothetical protein HU200_051288 [Digitaria exilis]KAF8700850.1 hypothetical protein HU200_034216 [Digitaria exilis]